MINLSIIEATNWLLNKEYLWLVKADDEFLSNWEVLQTSKRESPLLWWWDE